MFVIAIFSHVEHAAFESSFALSEQVFRTGRRVMTISNLDDLQPFMSPDLVDVIIVNFGDFSEVKPLGEFFDEWCVRSFVVNPETLRNHENLTSSLPEGLRRIEGDLIDAGVAFREIGPGHWSGENNAIIRELLEELDELKEYDEMARLATLDFDKGDATTPQPVQLFI